MSEEKINKILSDSIDDEMLGTSKTEEALNKKRACSYPKCNRKTDRKDKRYQNYFCPIHHNIFIASASRPNYSAIKEAISLSRKAERERILKVIDELNEKYPAQTHGRIGIAWNKEFKQKIEGKE